MNLPVPPYNLDAEKSVLGGLQFEPEALDQLAEILKPADFYLDSHRIIFSAMQWSAENQKPFDTISLAETLKGNNELERIGGLAYLTLLAQELPSTVSILYHAKIVREKSIRRSLINAGRKIEQRGFDETEVIEDALDSSEAEIFYISERGVKQAFVSIGEMMTPLQKKIENLIAHKSDITGVPTGFTDLDKITAGLQPSDLIVVAGRPSMGKTSLGLNIARNAASRGIGSAVFSLEMSREQLGLRLLCADARVRSSSVRAGFVKEFEVSSISRAAKNLYDAPIYIDDSPAISVLELRAKARRIVREKKNIGLIVVDYLQLMRGNSRASNREQEVADISRSLKALAKEMNVPVMALSQLNRKVEDRADRRPQMSDLRESGAIEMDADVIMFIYRDEVYNKDESKKGLAEVIVAKQRNGPTDTVNLTFIGEYTRFENYVDRSEEYVMEDVG